MSLPYHQPGSRSDPALGFWLRYVESEGALTEDDGERVVVLLTKALQERFELSEEFAVTANPEVAREEGALLLLPGHPTLDLAASTVLSDGDVGYAHLPLPPGPPISPSTLTARLRDQVTIDHGRLEVVDQPVTGYLPVLRVGVFIRYAVSLQHRFQEREEVFVDARNGMTLPPPVERALGIRALAPGTPTDRSLFTPDFPRAAGAAHSILAARAEARRGALAAEASDLLADELSRADTYYRGALDSIERRIEQAEPERQKLLYARAEATKAEAARRRIELEEQSEATYEVHPFRLHIIGLPALMVSATVSRGARRFPLQLTWLLQFQTFLIPSCPACGARAILVAGKDHLGCRECLSSRAEPAATSTSAKPSTSVISSDSTGSTNVERQPDMAKPSLAHKAVALVSPRSVEKETAAAPRRPAPTRRTTPRSRSSSATSKTGSKLATTLWSAVGGGGRWRAHGTASYSPFSALFRLYGNSGPAYAIGMLPGEVPERLSSFTYHYWSDLPHLTGGTLTSEGSSYDFAFAWRMLGAKPVVGEVLPTPDFVYDPQSLLDLPSSVRARLSTKAPSPIVPLDPVASLLWELRIRHNLAVAVRALAVWWWLGDKLTELAGGNGLDLAGIAPNVVADIIAAVVTSRGRDGIPRSSSQTQKSRLRLFAEEENSLVQLADLATGSPALTWGWPASYRK
jgi:hypothetical protein